MYCPMVNHSEQGLQPDREINGTLERSCEKSTRDTMKLVDEGHTRCEANANHK
jgi:hypothetical protein